METRFMSITFFTSTIIFGHVYAYIKSCEPVIPGRYPNVTIPNYGTFRGSVTSSAMKKRQIDQFLGIPYAMPPLGPRRFKPPVPWKNPSNDSSVYDATKFKRRCPQLVTDEDFEYLKENWENAEDCLYLNVFTLSSVQMKKDFLMPVMIYIHGGGWYQNSAVEHCPNYLLDNDIILVTLQYRLGVLGFLNLDHPDVAGNMGLLDTLEAIEWVKKYIVHFGGDNNRITIAGQSSGGVSVSLMLISPLVEPGLFHQAIVQSGNLFGGWVMDENSKEHALQFANYVNCNKTNVSAIVECLRDISSYNLTEANFKYMKDRMDTTQNAIKEVGITHAVVQKAGSKRFLSQHPKESLRSGNFLKIPVLTGVVRDEGSMCIEVFVNNILEPAYKRLNITNNNESIYLDEKLFHDFVRYLGIDENLHLLELSKESYLPLETYHNFNSTVPGLVDLAGDVVIKSITLDFARYVSQYRPTYLYTFNFKGRKTKLGYGRIPDRVYFDGVAHSDELLYLFPDVRNPVMNETEMKIVKYITTLWSSFVINGNASLPSTDLFTWPKMSTPMGPYVEIDKQMKVKSNFLETYRSSIRHDETRNNHGSNNSWCQYANIPLLIILSIASYLVC